MLGWSRLFTGFTDYPPGHPIMGHKNHITELTENKQIVVHKEERKKYLKKRGEHTTEVREQIQLGLGCWLSYCCCPQARPVTAFRDSWQRPRQLRSDRQLEAASGQADQLS